MSKAKRIGETVWFKGDEVVISSAPYEMYGGEFQNATRADGSTVSIATESQKAKNVAETRKARKDLQAGFARLNKEK